MLAVPVWLLLAFPAVAGADNFGVSRPGVVFQDDNLISYQYDTNLSTRMRNATAWTLGNSYATTDLNIVKASDGHTDIWNNQYAIGPMPDPSKIGYHQCIYYASSNRCKHAHIRYRSADLGDVTGERALACHETGHSVGLRHSGATANTQAIVRCMWNPVPRDPFVGPHNAAHINGFY